MIQHEYLISFVSVSFYVDIYFSASYVLGIEDIETLKQEQAEKIYSEKGIQVDSEEIVVVNIYKFERGEK